MSNDQSPFFRLSLEIRDMIYDGLLKATPIIDGIQGQHQFAIEIKVTYGKPSNTDVQDFEATSQRLPLWLLTNKEILQAGIRQLHFKGEWLLKPFMPYHGLQCGLPYCGLLDPLKAHRLVFERCNIYLMEELGLPITQPRTRIADSQLVLRRPDNNVWRRILEEFRAENSATEVKLYFGHRITCPRIPGTRSIQLPRTGGFQLDLSGFDSLGDIFTNAKRFEVETVNLDKDLPFLPDVQSALSDSIQLEIKKLAVKMFSKLIWRREDILESTTSGGEIEKWLFVFKKQKE